MSIKACTTCHRSYNPYDSPKIDCPWCELERLREELAELKARLPECNCGASDLPARSGCHYDGCPVRTVYEAAEAAGGK